MKRLENKVAIITGGNSGMGLATAQLFAREGAKVYVTARNDQRLSESSYLEEEGIRVNAISPGPIETPIFSKMDLTEEQQQQFAESIVAGIPMGRPGKSEEIARAALFLATDDSSFISGTELAVDGGMVQV